MAAQRRDHRIAGDHVSLGNSGEHLLCRVQAAALGVQDEQSGHQNPVRRETQDKNLAVDCAGDIESVGEGSAAAEQRHEGGPVGEDAFAGHGAVKEEDGTGVGVRVGGGADEVAP